MKQKKLLEFYENILDSLGIQKTGNGLLSHKLHNGETKPVTVAKKRLVLPTREILDEADWDNWMLFHPISEQANTKQSSVMNSFRGYMVADITKRISILMTMLVSLANKPDEQKKLGSKAKEYLNIIKDMDEKSEEAIGIIIRRIGRKPEDRLVNVHLRVGKGDEGTLRTCVIKFPFIEQLDELSQQKGTPISGIRKKDLLAITKLFHLVAGEEINKGSNNGTAPFFHATLASYKVHVERHNATLKLFEKLDSFKELDEIDSGTRNTEWFEVFEDFTEFAATHHHVAPPTEDNRPSNTVDVTSYLEDNIDVETVKETKPKSIRKHINPSNRNNQIQQEVQNDPTRNTSGGMSLSEFSNNYRRSRGIRLQEEQQPNYNRNLRQPMNQQRSPNRISIGDFSNNGYSQPQYNQGYNQQAPHRQNGVNDLPW